MTKRKSSLLQFQSTCPSERDSSRVNKRNKHLNILKHYNSKSNNTDSSCKNVSSSSPKEIKRRRNSEAISQLKIFQRKSHPMNNIRTPSEKKRKSFICDYPARRSSLTFGNIKRTIRLIPTNSFGSNTTYLNLNPKIKMVQSERRTSLFKLRKIKSIRVCNILSCQIKSK